MNQFVFTKKAERKFYCMPKPVQERILTKLRSLKSHPDLLSILKRLHHLEPASHRLRIGNYRLILELKIQNNEELVFCVLDLDDRKDVYK